MSVSTFVMLLVTLIVAAAFRTNILVVAIATAAIGGFVHEIVQSGGSVAYPQPKQDGFYLGSVSGLIFGAIAGVLVVQGLPATAVVDTALLSETFLAGLGLKGVAEAAGGMAKKPA